MIDPAVRSRSGGSAEATLPPLDASDGSICPACHRQAPDPTLASSRNPGVVPRCPEHQLAYVAVESLRASGGDPLLGATIAQRFVVLARLGVGSMGAVYRARQEAVGRDVALKIVRPDRAWQPDTHSRFEREARATSALTSPHTVTVFDFGPAQEGWYLAMELLHGETVGQRLRRVGRLGVDEAVELTRGVLRSLAEAHAKGIVHRDLKPDNLFIVRLPDGSGEQCKVLDFGIAKILNEEARVDALETQAGTVFGTPRYMSPEQAQGRPLDPRSDLYSLGVILFQMLTGRAPFVDDDAVVVMARHIRERPPSFRSVAPDARIPARIEELVRRMLAKDPATRPGSAEALLALLEPAASTGMTWAGSPPAGARALPWLVTLGLAALVVVAVMVAGSHPLRSRPLAAPGLPSSNAPVVAAVPPLSAVPSVTESSAPSASARVAPRPLATTTPRSPARSSARAAPRRTGERYGRFE